MINSSVIWVDLDRIDLSPAAKPMRLKIGILGNLGGEISSQFQPAPPFKFLTP